jgi:hypothetical protein
MRRGLVGTNFFLPIVRDAAKRERVLSDADVAEIWLAAWRSVGAFGPTHRLLIFAWQGRGEVASECHVRRR